MRETHLGTRRGRKNMTMDLDKLAAVRKILGVKTDTEAVDLALDSLLLRDELVTGLEKAADITGWVDFFHDPPPTNQRRKKLL